MAAQQGTIAAPARGALDRRCSGGARVGVRVACRSPVSTRLCPRRAARERRTRQRLPSSSRRCARHGEWSSSRPHTCAAHGSSRRSWPPPSRRSRASARMAPERACELADLQFSSMYEAQQPLCRGQTAAETRQNLQALQRVDTAYRTYVGGLDRTVLAATLEVSNAPRSRYGFGIASGIPGATTDRAPHAPESPTG